MFSVAHTYVCFLAVRYRLDVVRFGCGPHKEQPVGGIKHYACLLSPSALLHLVKYLIVVRVVNNSAACQLMQSRRTINDRHL